MASFLPVFFLFVITLGAMFAAWFITPKGPQQTLIRSSLLLTFTCCYMMWAITYLAQLHPMIGAFITWQALLLRRHSKWHAEPMFTEEH